MRSLTLILLALVASGLLAVASADEPESTVSLRPGANAVTWSGAEPYAIANFEGTPVRKVHRFDAVRQRWLSHVVGQDDATLPELHLLPRVQYLLKSDAAHELAIPNPLADIDPLAKLLYPSRPSDPLRFEAWWPNEDSPLEDLVVLRGEDERLSVEAWVAGGVGDVSVWWAIDGRVNHRGLASDDVELEPGGHDHGRLYAASGSGEIVVIPLPRIVKLPPLVLPEMTYGVHSHMGRVVWPREWLPGETYPKNMDAVEAALDLIAEAGFTTIRTEFTWGFMIESQEKGGYNAEALAMYDQLVSAAYERGLEIVALAGLPTPKWRSVSSHREDFWKWETVNPSDFGDHVGFLAKRWPQIRYWNVLEESNIARFWPSLDPHTLTLQVRAAALAAYHANPDVIIIAPSLTIVHEDGPSGLSIQTFLHSMYRSGLRDWTDIVNFHLFRCPKEIDGGAAQWFKDQIDDVASIMTEHGDTENYRWVGSTGYHTAVRAPDGVTYEVQAQCLTNILSLLTESDHVTGAFIYEFEDGGTDLSYNEDNFGMVEPYDYATGTFTPKPSYWAVREFLTGLPPP